MTMNNFGPRTKIALLVTLLGGSVLTSGAKAQHDPAMPGHTPAPAVPAQQQASPAAKTAKPGTSESNWHAFESTYYKRKWGVDIIGVRLVSSGQMIKFNYRVLDIDKAKPLNDKRWNPYLVDHETGAKLGIPEMDLIGKLRQTAPPEAGRIYWMVFGNPNHLVKAGNQVDVVIGDFRAEGLIVESAHSVLPVSASSK